MNSNYAMLLNRIKQKIQDGKFSTTTQQEKRNILRIGKIVRYYLHLLYYMQQNPKILRISIKIVNKC
jgi:hypothetical protein